MALLTAKLSPAAGGLAVSVPSLAYGLETFDDIEPYVIGTIDHADPKAAQAWGPRVQAFATRGPVALQRAPGMAAALKTLNPDVLDVQGLWTWSSKVSLDHHRRTERPYMITPRGMLDPWARSNSAWKKKLFGAFVETAHIDAAYVLRATANMEAQHFRNMGLKAPIATIPNAIETPPLAKRPPNNGRRRVAFLSRVHPKKGIDYLLRAWSALEGQFPEWDLTIAGIDEKGHEAEMKALASRMGLARVDFPGPVYGAAKDAFYRATDLFVLPTHSENFGLVVAEALAQEVPVITTKNAPWSGLIKQECGWWIELDTAVLEASMHHAMSLPYGALQQMGENGRNWIANEFAPQKIARQVRDVYLWLAKRGPRPDTVNG